MKESRLDRILGDFFLISGMELSLLNADLHTVALRKCPGQNFCSCFHRSKKSVEACRNSDMERLAEARSTRDPLIYTCPAGITEIIIPILREDRIYAYLFGTLGISSEEITDEEVLQRALSIAPELPVEELSLEIQSIRHLNRSTRDAYCRILTLLAQAIESNELLPHGKESIGALVKRYVRSNLSGKLTLTDMALSLHCSTVTLTQHFKAEFGMTVVEYITKKRMEQAERLLLTTDVPLREIAEAVGFSDVEYFSRTFKRHHGLPPAAWRKANT